MSSLERWVTEEHSELMLVRFPSEIRSFDFESLLEAPYVDELFSILKLPKTDANCYQGAFLWSGETNNHIISK